jgi:hypothetical protein
MKALFGLGASALLAFGPPGAMAQCIEKPADCAVEIGKVEAMIRDTPALAAVQKQIDDRIARFRRDRPRDWIDALDRDEAQFHRSLRRDMWFDDAHAVLDRDQLLEALQHRAADLAAMDVIANKPAGRWISAAGPLTLEPQANGDWLVEMYPVDTDYLGWTCEFEAVGRWRGDTMVLRPAKDETIRIRLRYGAMWVQHQMQDGYSPSCGHRGTLQGTYFGTNLPVSAVPRAPAAPQ